MFYTWRPGLLKSSQGFIYTHAKGLDQVGAYNKPCSVETCTAQMRYTTLLQSRSNMFSAADL